MRNNNDQKMTFFKGQPRSVFIYGVIAIILIIFISLSCYFIAKKSSENKKTATKTTTTTKTKTSKTDKTKVTQKQTICLDPGHGGNDIGASYGKIHEADINLTVALQTESILEKAGYQVYMTRDDDSYVAKRDRATYCNSINASILVSIHHNSYSQDHSVDYDTALYYKDSDQLLASSILSSTSDKLVIKNQGIAKFDNSLLWIAKMPAALSESFFITNKTEYGLITQSNQSRLTDEAAGIANGIINYFTHPESIKTSISNDSLIIDRTDLGD